MCFRRLCEGQTVAQLDSEPPDQHPRRYQLNDAINAEGEQRNRPRGNSGPNGLTASMTIYPKLGYSPRNASRTSAGQSHVHLSLSSPAAPINYYMGREFEGLCV